MRLKVHYVIEPQHLWSSVAEMARTQHDDLLVNGELVSLEEQIVTATNKHNKFLKVLGLPLLPLSQPGGGTHTHSRFGKTFATAK